MKKIISLLLCLSLCFTFICGTIFENNVFGDSSELVDKSRGIMKSLVWSDEFNGNKLDQYKWTTEMGDETSYSGIHYSTYREENIKVSNGCLDIKSQISFDNTGDDIMYSEYTGFVSSKERNSSYNHPEFNEIEIRAKLSPAYGVSSMTYLMGKDKIWPACGELDLFQYNNDTNLLTQALFTPKTYNISGSYNQRVWQTGLDKSKFHIFKMKWWDNKVEIYIDNVLTGTYDPALYSTNPKPTEDSKAWPFNQKMILYIIGSMKPQIAGARISEGWTLIKENEDSKDYETHTLIDYVRCYYSGINPNIEGMRDSTPHVDKAYKKKKLKKLTIEHYGSRYNNGSQARVYKSKKQAKKNKKYIVSKTKTTSGKTTIIKSKKIKNKKKLYVRVRHYLIMKGVRFYSKWSKPKKVKVKK